MKVMGCNCRVTEAILAVLILVFTFFWKASFSNWVVGISAVALLIHSIWCKSCCSMEEMPAKASKRKRR